MALEVERRKEEEPCRGGRTLLRYSAASKVGERKDCRKGSEVCADLGSILAGGVEAPGSAALDAARLWRESPRVRVVAAELFWRRRGRGVVILRSHVLIKEGRQNFMKKGCVMLVRVLQGTNEVE